MGDLSKQAVVDALSVFSKQIQEIISRIGDHQTVSTIEKNAIKALYRTLKADLKNAAARSAADEITFERSV